MFFSASRPLTYKHTHIDVFTETICATPKLEEETTYFCLYVRVYAQADGSRGLTIESKLFQPDEPVTYSLLDSTGLPSADFAVDDDGLVINLHVGGQSSTLRQ